jgi:FixJ family two-component response regulator
LNNAPVISIVDDDASFRRAIAQLIESLGYAVATFGSAEEFLRSEHVGDTACLISDVQMPGMSGIELQNRLIARGHRVPIIFVTAYSASEARVQALAAGALGFFDKPLSEEKLISCLENAGRAQLIAARRCDSAMRSDDVRGVRLFWSRGNPRVA